MAGYTKLFSSIVASTIWREKKETKIVWITLLAMANADGRVDASVPGLADLARVTVEECSEAIVVLSSPDSWSRSKEHNGRRIEEIPGGWLILNYTKYRENRDGEVRREQNREAQARWRERNKVSHRKPQLSTNKPPSAQAEAEAEAEKNTQKGASAPRVFVPPSAEEVGAYSKEIGYPLNGQAWCDSYAQKGWMVGKAKMKDWRAAVRNWKSNGWNPAGGGFNTNGYAAPLPEKVWLPDNLVAYHAEMDRRKAAEIPVQ